MREVVVGAARVVGGTKARAQKCHFEKKFGKKIHRRHLLVRGARGRRDEGKRAKQHFEK